MTGAAGRLVLGDWGTSHLRLWLCDGENVVDSLTGPGLAPLNAAGHRPADIFAEQVARWSGEHGSLPALLCGMVGANIGWTDAGYVTCPATEQNIAAAAVAVSSGVGTVVSIVPGLSCEGLLGGPEVMRGEETQIVGALALLPDISAGRQLFCLPGTHSKWAIVEHGAITGFQTALTGELFAVLQAHSILLARTATPASDEGFDAGLKRIRDVGSSQLLSLLFETRSRQLRLGMEAGEATGFLSGLLIGAEIEAMASLIATAAGSVVLVGAPALTSLYVRALASIGHTARVVDGDQAVRAGLHRLYQLGSDAA